MSDFFTEDKQVKYLSTNKVFLTNNQKDKEGKVPKNRLINGFLKMCGLFGFP